MSFVPTLGSRSPLRDCSNSLSSLQSPTLSPMHSSCGGMSFNHVSTTSYSQPQPYSALSTTSLTSNHNTNIELLNAKVSHLENERSNMYEQLFQLNEEDRKKKQQIEKLESSLKSNEGTHAVLTKALEDAQATIRILKEEKDLLVLEGKKLNDNIERMKASIMERSNLLSKATAASRELKRVEEEVEKLKKEKEEAVVEREHMSTVMETLRESNEKQSVEITSLKLEVEGQKLMFANSKKALEGDIANLEEENKKVAAELAQASDAMVLEREEFERERGALLDQISDLKTQLATRPAARAAEGVDEDDEDLESADLRTLVESLKKKLLQSEQKRKQLHNTLQELRGNIRVFVRCRPFLKGDGDEYLLNDGSSSGDPDATGCVKFHRDGSSVSLIGAGSVRNSGQVFAFDQVFKSSSSQDEVFKEVSELVQSALDGYKVCIFSYGQTGSGKTHTMTGEREGAMRGIIPRSVEQIVEQVQRMRADGWDVVVTASMLEIYNEELRDLLATNGASEKSSSASASSKLKVSFLQGYVTVAGLTAVELDTQDLRSGTRHLQQLLDRAGKSRMTACTAMNEHSSRSHLLFMLDINARHSDGTTYLRGGLRLCDLAGSERLDRTGTANDAARLKETVNINKSLSCLADVFMALSNKAQHIPYRNSKLTMVLQDCLSGDGKALMFVNVSPTSASTQETLCSLRFANQVSQVELGKATKSVFNVVPPQFAATMPPAPPASETSQAVSNALGNRALSQATRGAPRAIAAKATRPPLAAASQVQRAPVETLESIPESALDTSVDSKDWTEASVPAPASAPTTRNGNALSSAAIRGSVRVPVAVKRAAAQLNNTAAPSIQTSTSVSASALGAVGDNGPFKRSRQSIMPTSSSSSGSSTAARSIIWK